MKKDKGIFFEAARQQEESKKDKKSKVELMDEFIETNTIPEEWVFDHTKKYILEITGLELTTVELAGLKRIVSEVHKQDKDAIKRKFIDKEDENEIAFCYGGPVNESTARFLLEYYGIDEKISNWENLFEIKNNRPSSAVKEWFRRKQEEMHKL